MSECDTCSLSNLFYPDWEYTCHKRLYPETVGKTHVTINNWRDTHLPCFLQEMI